LTQVLTIQGAGFAPVSSRPSAALASQYNSVTTSSGACDVIRATSTQIECEWDAAPSLGPLTVTVVSNFGQANPSNFPIGTVVSGSFSLFDFMALTNLRMQHP